MLETHFGYACSGWVDDASDLPLLYSFYYLARGTAIEYQLVADTPSDSFDGALLPQGAGNASEVDAVAYVADQLAAATRAVDTVVVCPFGRAVPTSSGGVACRPPVVVTNLATRPARCSHRRSRRATSRRSSRR